MVAFIIGNSDPSSPILTTADMPQEFSRSSEGASTSSELEPSQSLIPEIPDDMAMKCLARVPFWYHGRCKTVCKGWKSLYSDPQILTLRKTERVQEEYLLSFGGNPSVCPGQLYCPKEKKWRKIPQTPVDLHSYGLESFGVVAAGRHVFLVGGVLFDSRAYPSEFPVASASVHRYDLLRNKWDTVASMTEARGSAACAVLLPKLGGPKARKDKGEPQGGKEEEEEVEEGAKIYVAGGDGRYATNQRRWSHLASAEVYDVSANKWAPLPPMNSLRAGGSGAVVDGKVVVFGGYGAPRLIAGFLQVSEQCHDSEIFSPSTESWSRRRLTWFPEDRACTGPVATVGDETFMLLGSTVLRLQLSCNLWCHEASLEWADRDASFFGMGGEIHIVPSEKVGSKHQKHYAYNPETKAWSHGKVKQKMRYLRQHQACKQPFRAVTQLML